MAAGFDPYHRWLSIPPSEQPPNHYRLLGLQEFEASVEVIENAARRQMTHVAPHLQSPLRPYAKNLIRELDVARKCLLEPEAKVAYDAWLEQRSKFAATETPSRVQPSAPERDSRDFFVAGSPFDSATSPANIRVSKLRRPKSKSVPIVFLIMWVAGGAIGLLAGYAVLCMLDPKYDFLHVMFSEAAPPLAKSPPSVAPPRKQSPRQNPAHPNSLALDRSRSKVEPDSDLEPTEPRRENASPNRLPRRPENLARTVPHLNVPDALPLPLLRVTDKPMLLTALAAESDAAPDLKKLQLSLAQGSNTDAGKLQLAADDDESAGEPSWDVRWIPASAERGVTNGPATVSIGKFSIAKNVLCFVWSAEVPRPAYSAARNSVLQVQLAPERHYCALRGIERVDPLSIDLSKPKALTPLNCGEMPELENIRVDIEAGTDLPRFNAVGAGLKGLKINDETTLWYQDAKGVSTRVRLLKRGRRPLIEVQSQFELPSGYRDVLTLTGGNLVLNSLRQGLANAQSLRAKARNAKDLKATTNKIKIIEKDLAALAPISNLAQELSGNVRLPVRFYFEVDGYEVDLAKSESDLLSSRR